MSLYCVTNITQMLSCHSLFDTQVQRFFSYLKELLNIGSYLSDSESIATVTVETF